MPGRPGTGPAGSGSITALYSQKNAAQSRMRSVAALRIGPPATSCPAACAALSRSAQPGTTRQWSSISATTGAVAAKTPAARSSGIVFCSSNERSFTVGQRSAPRPRRLVRPVGDDHLGVGAARREGVETPGQVGHAVHGRDHDRQPRESRSSSPQRVDVTQRLAGRPRGVVGKEHRQRGEKAPPEASAREHLARRAQRRARTARRTASTTPATFRPAPNRAPRSRP